MRYSTIILLAALSFSTGVSPGYAQDGPGNVRLINFDTVRTVCVSASVTIFDAESMASSTSPGGEFQSGAISLDQNWVLVVSDEKQHLVASGDLRFGGC